MIFFTFFIFAIFSRKWTFWITDNAVALHCCEAHAKVNRKIENSTPCNIIIHEYLNLAHVITSWTSPTIQLLGRIGPAGASLQIGEYNTFCCPIFFSFTRPGRTFAQILTLNGSNDVFPPKNGSFRGLDDEWRHLGGNMPQKLPKRDLNRQFQAETPKSIHRNIFVTINPTNKRFEDRFQTTKGTSWAVCH